MAHELTARELEAPWDGKDRWLSDGGSRGAGRLVAKLSQAGITWYFAYTGTAGNRRFWPIGPYHSKDAREGTFTLKRARDEAARLSSLHREIGRDLHDHDADVRDAEDVARREAAKAAQLAEARAKQSTLRQLLEAYTGHLERTGKESAGHVASTFRLHVFEAAPEVADTRAADVTPEDFVRIIAAPEAAGKGRTAAKLRSYLRAAYALAVRSHLDPAAPASLRAFGIASNPIAGIASLPQHNRTRDRHLSESELAAFLRRLDAEPEGVPKDALALCLLLGGQRPAQLMRLRPVDVDLDAGALALFDPKGRRLTPRRHVLPIVGKAAPILARLTSALPERAPLVFGGLRPEAITRIVRDISAAMLAADPKESREPFELRDLRRTCETMLAALKISSDVRAQIQSHGLGGVQTRHYDRHDYADEKRQALAKWQRHLERIKAGEPAKVVSLDKRRRAQG